LERARVPEDVDRAIREDPAPGAQVRAEIAHEPSIVVVRAKVEPRDAATPGRALEPCVVPPTHGRRDRRVVVVRARKGQGPDEPSRADFMQHAERDTEIAAAPSRGRPRSVPRRGPPVPRSPPARAARARRSARDGSTWDPPGPRPRDAAAAGPGASLDTRACGALPSRVTAAISAPRR